jgi:protein AATF/BFR2
MLQSDTEGSCGRFLLPAAADADAAAAAAAANDSNDEDDDAVHNTINSSSTSSSSRASRWRSDPVDTEVLDDRELYQHLLKEFVEAGAAGSSSALASGRLRQRKRRRVDTRASKGRKLRYEPHPKLQNFTFPQEYGASPMDADELFASLFGQSRNRGSAVVRSSSSGGANE